MTAAHVEADKVEMTFLALTKAKRDLKCWRENNLLKF